MTRNEAIEHAEKLSIRGKPLAVIFDKEYNNYFITESERFYVNENFYQESTYEVIGVYMN